MLITTLLAALAAAKLTQAVDLTNLPKFLKDASADIFPSLKAIAVQVYHDPELGRDEQHAHDLVMEHFSALQSKGDGWIVEPHAHGLPTAWRLEFEHRPQGFDGPLPTVGFMAEYDALAGVGHACGHNHILLNGVTAPSLAREALIEYDLPGRIIVLGCPDEENAAGKAVLEAVGAFDDAEVWLMAHPTKASAVQPMNSRLNSFFRFRGNTHQEAVRKAYEAMIIVQGLKGQLPGTASSASNIENVGVYATNVVQSLISLGVSGSTRAHVDEVVSSILDSTYPGVSYVLFEDANGVGINITGPGGHASESTKGALVLSVETFRRLTSESSSPVSFYLPGNTTSKELEITVDMRTRYTTDIPAVAEAVNQAVGSLAASISSDLKYPSLEVVPFLPETFIDLLATDDYGLRDWAISDFAPASSDASWVQSPTLDDSTHELLGVKRVVFHPNYNICEPGGPCAFNHEPAFAEVAGTEFSYVQTEIVARAEAQLAIELIADEGKMDEATAIIR